MKLASLVLAVSVLSLSACVTPTPQTDDTVLQQAASYFVSISQHPEAVEPVEVTREIDRIAAQAPNDPFVQRYAVLARVSLIAETDNDADRMRLAREGLAILDRAVALPGADGPPRHAVMAGEAVDVDLSDAKGIRDLLTSSAGVSR